MEYGIKLIKSLENEIEMMQKAIDDRFDRIDRGMTDMDDCFVSQRFEERGIANNRQKIDLIKKGGCEWFAEYATLDGTLVNARWCSTKFGSSLRAEMPDGRIVWTTATTAKGLAKKGLKRVECLRPAWYTFHSNGSGMFGAYTGSYVLYPSNVNYATGEEADTEPIEIKEA